MSARSIHIKDINLQNVGPLNRFSAEFKRINLIYGHNERGKTFLVEFIVQSLFRSGRNWRLRKNAGSGKVRLAGIDPERLVVFSPSSGWKLESFFEEQQAGLPTDFSKLLVVKGAEVGLTQAQGGIDKNILRNLLSNKGVLDVMQERISKTLRETSFSDGRLSGPNRGEVSGKQQLESRLQKIETLLQRIDQEYSGGLRYTLEGERKALNEKADRLLQAKRYLAYKVNQKAQVLKLSNEKVSLEDALKLTSELTHFRKEATQYKLKQTRQLQAAEKSREYTWLINARGAYQAYLDQEVATPPKLWLIAAIVFALSAAILIFMDAPLYVLGSIVMAAGCVAYYVVQLYSCAISVIENNEMEELRQEFERKFATSLNGLHDISTQLEFIAEDHNRAQVWAKELNIDLGQLNTGKLKIAEQIYRFSGKRIERADWGRFVGELEESARLRDSELRKNELFLAQLDVDASDFQLEEPGLAYSKRNMENVALELKQNEKKLSDLNQNLSSLKQMICQETNDDISEPWESVIANLRNLYNDVVEQLQQKTAEILGKLAVNQVIEALRLDEESKIISGLKSPFIQEPVYQLTNRYNHVELEAERLIVSDKFSSFDLENLSSGAQEQVLLGLRIGFATKMMQRDCMFLILDDAFQYSDWLRRKLLVDKAFELAEKGWQILYFTMDDNIQTLFDQQGEKIGDDYLTINLNRKQDGQPIN